MFCDLVDSTGIAARLDAEEWRYLVGAYFDVASAAVTEVGGHVAKKLGDGLMALFGYPEAQENDAERAVRAALSIQRALAELNRQNEGAGKPAMAARIAIDTGPAVLDAGGEIFGDVPNIAAQALAEPGAVVVTARVQRQVAGLFVAEERGSHELKGVPELVTLLRIIRASGAGRRTGQRHLTPLIGRDEEISMLMRRWERARQGDGQLVLIIGEPGIGKSRLIEEFHGRLRDTPHTWVEWSCLQLLQNTSLHPVTEWGHQRFGGADVPAERRLADLENSLTLIKLDPAENVPLLAALLDMPLPKERMLALAAGGAAATAIRGSDRLDDREREGSAGGAGIRGSALGRSDGPRRKTILALCYEQTVEAFQAAALLEFTRERAPFEWAGTQNNFGNVLRMLGELENDVTRLKQAVEAYQAALLEWTRERVPIKWAGTQTNLGTALRMLGEHESDLTRLGQAVEAYQAALLEFTRERAPFNWAGTQNNLGTALQGKRK